jgi:hypothetical protein
MHVQTGLTLLALFCLGLWVAECFPVSAFGQGSSGQIPRVPREVYHATVGMSSCNGTLIYYDEGGAPPVVLFEHRDVPGDVGGH